MSNVISFKGEITKGNTNGSVTIEYLNGFTYIGEILNYEKNG